MLDYEQAILFHMRGGRILMSERQLLTNLINLRQNGDSKSCAINAI